MLTGLEIQNYALIESLKVDLGKGLNIITGETGAGKSIILGAVGLIMGQRADSKVLYDTNSKCFVEAKFDTDLTFVKEYILDNDLDYELPLMIRREILTSGKSRAFVNDTPVTLDVLQGLTELLIDVHQQNNTQLIQKPSVQLEIIDVLAKSDNLKQEYGRIYSQQKSLIKKHEELKEISQKAQSELDYNMFLLQELMTLNLIEDNQVEMEADLKVLESAGEIRSSFHKVSQGIFESDRSIVSQLQSLLSELRHVTDISPTYEEVNSRLVSAIEELKDIASESADIAENTEIDEEQLAYVSERLSNIYRLQKKHNLTSISELISLRDTLDQKVNQYRNIDQELVTLSQALVENTKTLNEVGKKLSISRQSVTEHFCHQVSDLLGQLAMPNAKISVQFKELTTPGPNGIDAVELLFAANKGGELLPLKDVASGGETSRLALCIKTVLADNSTLPCMIFDEIDTGVSGEVAHKMGLMLTQLAEKHQVITITHSAQVAAKANRHYFVYKYDTTDRTLSNIKELDRKGRVNEIAQMISGNPPTDSALQAANDMIGSI